MADRYPLVVGSGVVQEIAASDNLKLESSGIVGVTTINGVVFGDSGSSAIGLTDDLKNISIGSTFTATGVTTNNINIGNGNFVGFSSGIGNIAIGHSCLASFSDGGSYNIAIGHGALTYARHGLVNIAIGLSALHHNQTGGQNIAVGNNACRETTSGVNNMAFGVEALRLNTTGSYNSAYGVNTLERCETGSQNSAFGNNAGGANIDGDENVFAGNSAAGLCTSVGYSVIVGHQAGYGRTAGAASYSVLIGWRAGFGGFSGIATGSSNHAVGHQSLYNVNGGADNTALGKNTLYSLTSGSNNTAIGVQAGYGPAGVGSCTTGSNNTFIGNNAVDTAGGATASNTIVLGNSSITTLRCQTQTISALSDARDKKDIQDLPVGLEFINDLRPVRFTWDQRDGGRVDLPDSGFIAQESLEVVESHDVDWLGLVDHQNPEHYEMSYGKLIPILVKAVQELSAENASLKARLDAAGF